MRTCVHAYTRLNRGGIPANRRKKPGENLATGIRSSNADRSWPRIKPRRARRPPSLLHTSPLSPYRPFTDMYPKTAYRAAWLLACIFVEHAVSTHRPSRLARRRRDGLVKNAIFHVYRSISGRSISGRFYSVPFPAVPGGNLSWFSARDRYETRVHVFVSVADHWELKTTTFVAFQFEHVRFRPTISFSSDVANSPARLAKCRDQYHGRAHGVKFFRDTV